MRVLHTAAAFTAISALALTLTACGDSGDSSASDQSSAPASSPTATASSAAPAGDASATEDAGTGTDTSTATAASSSRCTTAGLAFSFGSGDGTINSSDDQQQLPVVLKNKGSASCTLQGFPGVDLKASDGTWSLLRSSVTAKKVTLAPGSSATFTITYLPWTEDGGVEFKATSVVITPPNETTSATLTWPGGSVLRQDGATRPGTYTGPVGG